ncbi:hypothetical protein MP228_010758 [Amoeboaphelidium protococcarum]|nr:hypothetical protein MP228_010758 [Amoeboaphelidium protococcarum]
MKEDWHKTSLIKKQLQQAYRVKGEIKPHDVVRRKNLPGSSNAWRYRESNDDADGSKLNDGTALKLKLESFRFSKDAQVHLDDEQYWNDDRDNILNVDLFRIDLKRLDSRITDYDVNIDFIQPILYTKADKTRKSHGILRQQLSLITQNASPQIESEFQGIAEMDKLQIKDSHEQQQTLQQQQSPLHVSSPGSSQSQYQSTHSESADNSSSVSVASPLSSEMQNSMSPVSPVSQQSNLQVSQQQQIMEKTGQVSAEQKKRPSVLQDVDPEEWLDDLLG